MDPVGAGGGAGSRSGRSARMKAIRSLLPVVVVAIAATLFMAPNASAFEWKVEGKGLAANESVKTTNENPATKKPVPFLISGTVLGIPVTIECQVMSTQGEFIGPLVVIGVIIIWGACALRAESEGACKVGETIKTNELKGEVTAISGRNYVKLKPSSGTTIATLTFNAECALGEKVVLSGEICGKGETTGVELVTQPLTYSTESATNCKTSLSLGTKAASLTGSSWSTLSGKNVGKKWTAS
jgi:hypothetical protein